jgi:hypothetical protein
MTLPSFRSAEPLYIITLRNTPQAEAQFKTWIRDHRVEHASVSGNRMMLHHQQAFDRFLVSWTASVDSMTIWDTWHRRHIYLD